jgi:hypothetical protein
MIGYCGLDCSKCEAYIATARNDDAMRARTAEQWSKQYGAEMSPASINCTGCRSDGAKLNYCENMCEIRKCALPRKVDTCADCPDYGCEALQGFLKMAPAAKEALETIRNRRPNP